MIIVTFFLLKLPQGHGGSVPQRGGHREGHRGLGPARADVFLATKISSGEAQLLECHDLVRRQLRDLRTDYIDLCE